MRLMCYIDSFLNTGLSTLSEPFSQFDRTALSIPVVTQEAAMLQNVILNPWLQLMGQGWTPWANGFFLGNLVL